MLLQSNSYIVPKEKRADHAKLVRRMRQTMARLGCDQFDVFEQVQPNWGAGEPTGRFVQMMKFRDRRHQQAVQSAEQRDPSAQQLIAEFCELINFPYQQQQGLFGAGFYQSVLPVAPPMRGVEVEFEQVDAQSADEAGLRMVEEADTAEPAGEGAASEEPEPEPPDEEADLRSDPSQQR